MTPRHVPGLLTEAWPLRTSGARSDRVERAAAPVSPLGSPGRTLDRRRGLGDVPGEYEFERLFLTRYWCGEKVGKGSRSAMTTCMRNPHMLHNLSSRSRAAYMCLCPTIAASKVSIIHPMNETTLSRCYMSSSPSYISRSALPPASQC